MKISSPYNTQFLRSFIQKKNYNFLRADNSHNMFPNVSNLKRMSCIFRYRTIPQLHFIRYLLRLLSLHDNKVFHQNGENSALDVYFGGGPLLTILYVCPILPLKIHRCMTIYKREWLFSNLAEKFFLYPQKKYNKGFPLERKALNKGSFRLPLLTPCWQNKPFYLIITQTAFLYWLVKHNQTLCFC